MNRDYSGVGVGGGKYSRDFGMEKFIIVGRDDPPPPDIKKAFLLTEMKSWGSGGWLKVGVSIKEIDRKQFSMMILMITIKISFASNLWNFIL